MIGDGKRETVNLLPWLFLDLCTLHASGRREVSDGDLIKNNYRQNTL